jgi:glycosyltransferase 2 family protein
VLKNYQKIGLLALLVGVALFIYLVERTGPWIILNNIRLLRASFFLVLLTSGTRQCFRTVAWNHCIEQGHRNLSFFDLFRIRLAAETITGLTFAGPFLGETAKAYVVAKRMPLAYGLSSIVIENLIYSLSVVFFIVSGVLLLLLKFAIPEPMRIASLLVGLAVLLPMLAAFVIIRRKWMVLGKLLDRLKGKGVKWSCIRRQEQRIRLFEENVVGFYGRHRRIFFWVLFLEVLSCFTGVVEAYIIMKVTVGRSSLSAAFIIESVYRSVNVIFAFVPLRVGVDEGGAALALNALGFTLAEGVSLAIIRKIRMLLWMGIGLLIIFKYTLADKLSSQNGTPTVVTSQKSQD